MIEIIGKTNINFMEKRKIALPFSALLILIGLIAVVQIARGAANLGIDFAGGSSVQIKFGQDQPLKKVRQILKDAGIGEFDLQDLPSENKILIRTKKKEEQLGVISETIVSALKKGFPEDNLVVDSTTQIGPKVGKKLRLDALYAIIAAVVCILFYIAWRFQFSFGIGATVATFHDVMAVLGIFYLLGKEINLILVSALLMIAGYSLTDTVVVFDRIRENLRFKYKETIERNINSSINEVLSRTIITSLTTFFSAASLFFFGGEVIHDFAFAIMLGIIIGTYSSIFVASPVVLLWSGKKAFSKK